MDLTIYDIYCMNIEDLKEMSDTDEKYRKNLTKKANTLLKARYKVKNKINLSHHDLKTIYNSLQENLDDIKEEFKRLETID